jgi:deoxyinosine 3'endonuclease (endonuclease V)
MDQSKFLQPNNIEELIKEWEAEQIELKKRLQLYDTEPWEINKSLYEKNNKLNNNEYLRYVAGFDISFIKDTQKACSGLFVFDLNDNMNIVYCDLDNEPVEISQPYVKNLIDNLSLLLYFILIFS